MFKKSLKCIDNLFSLLKERGLSLKEEDKNHLQNIGYYRLSGYFYYFLDDKEKHSFKENISFKDILNIYKFDRKLRLLIFGEI